MRLTVKRVATVKNPCKRLLYSFCQRQHSTSHSKAEGEQIEIRCLMVFAVPQDVHSGTECDHDVLLLMQTRRQAHAAQNSQRVEDRSRLLCMCENRKRVCVCAVAGREWTAVWQRRR